MGFSHVHGTGAAAPGTSIAITPPNLTAGNLAVVSIAGYNATTYGISDTKGNTWTLANSQSPYGVVWYSAITTGGSSTITVTSTTSTPLSISYDEYSPGSGNTVAFDNANGNYSLPVGSISTGNVTVSGTDLFYASFTGSGSGGTYTASGVSNPRYSVNGASGYNQTLYVFDSLNVTSSPQSSTGTYSLSGQQLTGIGVTFRLVGASQSGSGAALLPAA